MEPTWQILPDPLTADYYTSSDSSQLPQTARLVGGLLGHGLLRPFRRDGNGDFESGDGARLIRAAVGLVLMTMCSSRSTLGELPWRTEFGSLLQVLRLRNNDTDLDSDARDYVIAALERWVPAVEISDVALVRGNANVLFLKVVYDVVDPVGARVLVPGIQTAVPIG